MNNEALKVLKERRSCRSYKAQQITDAELDAVLEAGTYAPAAGGKQSAIIVAVQNPETIAQLRKMNAEIMGNPGSDPFYGAPTVLVVLARKEVHTAVEDGSLTMGSMMLAAESIGLACCWIHRARESFETAEGKQLLAAWGLDPEGYIGVGNLILGYAAEGGKKPAAARNDGRVIYVK